MKLTTHLHLVQRLKMCGAIPPFPQYTFMVWCSVKAQGQLYLHLSHLAHVTLTQPGETHKLQSSPSCKFANMRTIYLVNDILALSCETYIIAPSCMHIYINPSVLQIDTKCSHYQWPLKCYQWHIYHEWLFVHLNFQPINDLTEISYTITKVPAVIPFNYLLQYIHD